MSINRRFILLFFCIFIFAVMFQFAKHFGANTFLWVFPLGAELWQLGLWIFSCFLYVALSMGAMGESKIACRGKQILCLLGLPFFCALQGVLWLGILASIFPVVLWMMMNLGSRQIQLFFWGILIVLLLKFSHQSVLVEPSFFPKLSQGRFALSFLGVLFFYKVILYGMGVLFRKEKPKLEATIEYFLAPPFWLNPNHATMILWGRLEKIERTLSFKEYLQAWGWILRAVLHACLFIYSIRFFKPIFTETFLRGLDFRKEGVELFFVGVSLFFVSYLEKSRINYFIAGVFRLAGFAIEPDFRAPWLARNFLDFWRRYHYWVLEFFVDTIYFPLTAKLRYSFSVRFTAIIGIFCTFFIASSLSHYVNYPGVLRDCLLLSLLTALLVLVHYVVAELYKIWQPENILLEHGKKLISFIGIPLTWATISYLWLLNYAVFGMGWSLDKVWSMVHL